LDSTQVFFNGTPAPLLYTSDTQVAALVPYSVFGATLQVSISHQGGTSSTVPVPLAASAPGLFTLDGSGQGQAAAVNPDGSINGAAKPARIGDVILLYCTGDGETSPAPDAGKLASYPIPVTILPVTVTIGGQTVKAEYSGGTPGYVAGFTQINVQVPAGVTPGSAVPVSIQVGGVSSQAGVTIAVAGN
jgi:uncharacterized protein (TIGR03437 family)